MSGIRRTLNLSFLKLPIVVHRFAFCYAAVSKILCSTNGFTSSYSYVPYCVRIYSSLSSLHWCEETLATLYLQITVRDMKFRFFVLFVLSFGIVRYGRSQSFHWEMTNGPGTTTIIAMQVAPNGNIWVVATDGTPAVFVRTDTMTSHAG